MTDFCDLLEQEIPRLRRYARALSRDPSRADDLVQDCLCRALRKAHLWQPGTDLRAWLFTMMHHQNVNYVRTAVRTGYTVPIEDVESLLTTAANQSTSLIMRDLDRALGRLSEEHRQVLLLVGLEGLNYEQVSQVLAVPVGTVRSRLSRARQALRELMDHHPVRPAAAMRGTAPADSLADPPLAAAS